MIKRCKKCGFTMRDVCSSCKTKTSSAHPPKFSVSDKYAKYRRIAKAKA